MRSFLGSDTTLSVEQRAFIEEAMSLMPAMYAAPQPEAQEIARKLEMRLAPLFTREQAYWIFAHLGPPEPPEGIPSPGSPAGHD